MKKPRHLKNEKGFAVIESIMILFIFLIMFWYSIGFFGITHTAVLQSIASRNYAFEIFRHRSHLWYFRSNSDLALRYHQGYVNRLHGTNNEIAATGTDKQQYATERRVAMFKRNDEEPLGRSQNDHAQATTSISSGTRNSTISTDPVWIRVQYGICLTAACGE